MYRVDLEEKARRFETSNSNVSRPEDRSFFFSMFFLYLFFFYSSYIIGALQADPSLPYSLPKLIKLVQMDVDSWTCHREWIVYVWNHSLVAV